MSVVKKLQPPYQPTHKHDGIDPDLLETKFADLLAPIDALKEERAMVWSRWVWETGSEADRNRADELDFIIAKKEHLAGLFDRMVKPIGK